MSLGSPHTKVDLNQDHIRLFLFSCQLSCTVRNPKGFLFLGKLSRRHHSINGKVLGIIWGTVNSESALVHWSWILAFGKWGKGFDLVTLTGGALPVWEQSLTKTVLGCWPAMKTTPQKAGQPPAVRRATWSFNVLLGPVTIGSLGVPFVK